MIEFLFIITSSLLVFSRSLYSLYRLQSYDYYAVFKAKPILFNILISILLGAVALTMEYLSVVGYIGFSTLSIVFSALILGGYFSKRTRFKFTARALRVTLPYWLIIIALNIIFSLVLNGIYRIIALVSVVLLSEIILFVVSGCVSPFERKRNFNYAYRLTKRVRNKNLIKIVITGSYGKTTCKNILTALLSEKYRVIATERNYNTPLGIAKTVSNLSPAGFSEGEKPIVFIAEAGARRIGDVRKICELVTPTYGIVTGVCAMHLDTFRSVERIKRAKQELADYIGENGTVIFNGDNEHTLEMSKEFKGKSVVVGLKNGDINIFNLKTTVLGSTFDLRYGDKVIALKTSLLGRHNALNVALTVALALELGIDIESIVKAVGNLKATEHRLQVIVSGGITILDDSYNGNLVGVKEALNLIASYGGRKVIYAQGIVECGRQKGKINQEIGRAIGKVAEVVMLSGENSKHLLKGLKEVGFKGEIFKFSTIMHAKDSFKNILKQGDIFYIQNDIP